MTDQQEPAREWWTVAEVVDHYRFESRGALYLLRHRGRGPKAHKRGRKLLFHIDDLKAWEASLAERERTSA